MRLQTAGRPGRLSLGRSPGDLPGMEQFSLCTNDVFVTPVNAYNAIRLHLGPLERAQAKPAISPPPPTATPIAASASQDHRHCTQKLTARRVRPRPMTAAGGGDLAAAGGAEQQVLQLRAVDLTPESFAPFGQVVAPTEDGKPFDEEDAQLELSAGLPRFYIMRLPPRGRRFSRITYHARVTQCLGGVQPRAWYLGVAVPTLSLDRPPAQADLVAFRIPHGVCIKLHRGTWHAGPLFDGEAMDFINLENADTNVTDHNTHHFRGFEYEVVD